MASNTIIQYSSSSSSHAIRTTYDVFVSFRGEDTRNNFTAFLFQALRRNGIDAFKDDADLKKGEFIAPELLQAIEGSRLFVVVFSKNYASSTWCLRELAHICNCTDQASPSRVLPIFYDVDPSEVRKQSGNYEIAFAEHEERFREDKEKMEEVLRWRAALTRVANLSGWDIRNKSQPALIEEIVQKIINVLGSKFSSLPNDNLVGVESCGKELAELLCLGSVNQVRVVGISGMGGIGKSTLSRALYERISHQYDFRCFIEDVSKIYRDTSALGVQKHLLAQCLNEKNQEICNASDGTCLVWARLRNVKALIVLDNVDQVEQLNMFTGNRETLLHECLREGSKIIIISRDEHILRTHGVNHIYQVQLLNLDNAVQLFCRNAFKCNYIVSDYEVLTEHVLSHAQGHPLAIKVIGKSLFGRNVSQWRSTLTRLRDNKSRDIMDVLRISYDDLEGKDREIFLDIACFFAGDSEQHVKKILDFRGFDPEIGLPVLVDKSLITIWNGKIYKHDLLRDLGKCIVREKSPKEPRKWSRLWDYEDLYKVMLDNMEAENLEAVVVKDISSMFLETTMRIDALSKMKNLKILLLLKDFYDDGNFSGNLNCLSNELGYLTWQNYPFDSLPQCFQPHKLFELNLTNSNIKQLWEGRKPLPNLRCLDVSDCTNLIELPNLCDAPNLKSLNLRGCIRLRWFHPSVGFPRNLTVLDLCGCKSLVELPHFVQALKLEVLNLEGCIQLRQIPPSIGHLRKLTVLNLKECRSLTDLPHFVEDLNLEVLNLEGCVQLRQIHPSIGHLRKLTVLNLKECRSLTDLPHFVEDLNLEELNLEGCAQLRQIHPSIGHLRKLIDFNLKNCKTLVSLPNTILGPYSLKWLSLIRCSNLYNIHYLSEERWDARYLKKLRMGEAASCSQSRFSFLKKWLSRLFVAFEKSFEDAHKDSVGCLLPSLPIFSCMRQLDLSFCNLLKIPDAFGDFHFLEKLCLRGNNFETLPSLKDLSKLSHLNLEHCKRLKYLPELPSRTDLPEQRWRIVEYDEYECGLNTFNCPELVERDCSTRMCLLWMMQFIKAYNPEWWWVPGVSSIIPGSEIPRWFDKQHVSMGNVINIEDASHSMKHDNNCIGIALSVVFVVHKERRMSPPDWEQRRSLYIPLLFREDLVTDESDHMWLFYCPQRHFTFYFTDSLDVVVECRSSDLDHLDVEVKKYGHRWVYKHDIELSNLTTMHHKNSSPQERKFLEIEENK